MAFSFGCWESFPPPMLPSAGEVKFSRGIQRDPPRIAAAAGGAPTPADDFHRLIPAIENLHTAVAEFTDILIAGGINPHVVRVTQFAQGGAGASIRSQPLPLGRKNLDAMVARVGHIKPVCCIHSEYFSAI